MYQPPQFKSSDTSHAAEIMRKYPLASMISTDDEGFPLFRTYPFTLLLKHTIWLNGSYLGM
jgi:transcriptional regulator